MNNEISLWKTGFPWRVANFRVASTINPAQSRVLTAVSEACTSAAKSFSQIPADGVGTWKRGIKKAVARSPFFFWIAPATSHNSIGLLSLEMFPSEIFPSLGCLVTSINSFRGTIMKAYWILSFFICRPCFSLFSPSLVFLGFFFFLVSCSSTVGQLETRSLLASFFCEHSMLLSLKPFFLTQKAWHLYVATSTTPLLLFSTSIPYSP